MLGHVDFAVVCIPGGSHPIAGEPLHQDRAAVWILVTPPGMIAFSFSLTIFVKVEKQTSHKSFHWFWCLVLLAFFPKPQIQSGIEPDSVFFMFIIILLLILLMPCWKYAWQVFLIWRESTRKSYITCKLMNVIFFFLKNNLLPFPTPCSCRCYQYEKNKVMLEQAVHRSAKNHPRSLHVCLFGFFKAHEWFTNSEVSQVTLDKILPLCLPLITVVLHSSRCHTLPRRGC